jgi:hypothetical protein
MNDEELRNRQCRGERRLDRNADNAGEEIEQRLTTSDLVSSSIEFAKLLIRESRPEAEIIECLSAMFRADPRAAVTPSDLSQARASYATARDIIRGGYDKRPGHRQ